MKLKMMMSLLMLEVLLCADTAAGSTGRGRSKVVKTLGNYHEPLGSQPKKEAVHVPVPPAEDSEESCSACYGKGWVRCTECQSDKSGPIKDSPSKGVKLSMTREQSVTRNNREVKIDDEDDEKITTVFNTGVMARFKDPSKSSEYQLHLGATQNENGLEILHVKDGKVTIQANGKNVSVPKRELIALFDPAKVLKRIEEGLKRTWRYKKCKGVPIEGHKVYMRVDHAGLKKCAIVTVVKHNVKSIDVEYKGKEYNEISKKKMCGTGKYELFGLLEPTWNARNNCNKFVWNIFKEYVRVKTKFKMADDTYTQDYWIYHDDTAECKAKKIIDAKINRPRMHPKHTGKVTILKTLLAEWIEAQKMSRTVTPKTYAIQMMEWYKGFDNNQRHNIEERALGIYENDEKVTNMGAMPPTLSPLSGKKRIEAEIKKIEDNIATNREETKYLENIELYKQLKTMKARLWIYEEGYDREVVNDSLAYETSVGPYLKGAKPVYMFKSGEIVRVLRRDSTSMKDHDITTVCVCSKDLTKMGWIIYSMPKKMQKKQTLWVRLVNVLTPWRYQRNLKRI